MKNLEALYCNVSLRDGGPSLTRQCQYRSSFTTPGLFRHKTGVITVRHCPCVSTLCLPDVTARDQISHAFPVYICILQVIKYWRWEQPGNEAIICCVQCEISEPHIQAHPSAFISCRVQNNRTDWQQEYLMYNAWQWWAIKRHDSLCAYNQLIWGGIHLTSPKYVYKMCSSLSVTSCFTTLVHNPRKDFLPVSNVSPTLLHTHCAPKLRNFLDYVDLS